MSEELKTMVRREVRKLDPDLDENDSVFGAACVLLAIVSTGQTSIPAVAKAAGVTQRAARKYVQRLRDNGVLRGRTMHIEWAEGGEDSGIAFWLDAMVADGMLERTTAP